MKFLYTNLVQRAAGQCVLTSVPKQLGCVSPADHPSPLRWDLFITTKRPLFLFSANCSTMTAAPAPGHRWSPETKAQWVRMDVKLLFFLSILATVKARGSPTQVFSVILINKSCSQNCSFCCISVGGTTCTFFESFKLQFKSLVIPAFTTMTFANKQNNSLQSIYL